MDKREEFIKNLREFADWMESHPNVPLPETYGGHRFYSTVQTVDELRKSFHLTGPWDKELVGETANYYKRFGSDNTEGWKQGAHLTYRLSLPREEVCTKRVVGQKWVPGYEPVQYASPGHYEDVVEWDCI